MALAPSPCRPHRRIRGPVGTGELKAAAGSAGSGPSSVSDAVEWPGTPRVACRVDGDGGERKGRHPAGSIRVGARRLGGFRAAGGQRATAGFVDAGIAQRRAVVGSDDVVVGDDVSHGWGLVSCRDAGTGQSGHGVFARNSPPTVPLLDLTHHRLHNPLPSLPGAMLEICGIRLGKGRTFPGDRLKAPS